MYYKTFLSFFFTTFTICDSRNVLITSCSANYQQPGYLCKDAHDGVTVGTTGGWAFSGSPFPNWAIFNLEKEVMIRKVSRGAKRVKTRQFSTGRSLKVSN